MTLDLSCTDTSPLTQASIVCRRYIPPDSLQDTQERQGREHRDLHLLRRRFSNRHQAEAARKPSQ